MLGIIVAGNPPSGTEPVSWQKPHLWEKRRYEKSKNPADTSQYERSQCLTTGVQDKLH